MARVIVADDCERPRASPLLRRIASIEVVAGDENSGLRRERQPRPARRRSAERDVVVLNSDVEALRGWLHACSTPPRRSDDVGIVGAQLLYPDGRIQFGGTVRNRERPSGSTIATASSPRAGARRAAGPVLAVTGAACTCGAR